MTLTWTIAAIWFGLAMISSLLSRWLKISTALIEILVGVAAPLTLGWLALGQGGIGSDQPWIAFLAGSGAILLTFLAGAEIEVKVFKEHWQVINLVGIVGFFAPFFGCAAVAYYILHWSAPASWLAGIALSTTSVAVVYAVMVELGLNRTKFGKVVLSACFVNDLGTVLALGFIFAPFTWHSLIFVGVTAVVCVAIYYLTPPLFKRYGKQHSEVETKYFLIILFALGALATWAGSEAVLPAYILGMLLARVLEADHQLVARLRTLTFGFLTPFYFIRAGSLVSMKALIATPLVFIILLVAKMITKSLGVYPAVKWSKYPEKEAIYTTLLMSTGLTFGTISALFGLSRNIIDAGQYSNLIATVIASAIIPTIIANRFFLPRHLIPKSENVPPEVPLPSRSTSRKK